MMTETKFAEPVERGCGFRQEEGIYWELGFSEHGEPLERFIICPSAPIDAKAVGLAPVGVQLFEIAGVHHILDWIGAMSYPNPTDFLEEARRFGVSRRCELHAKNFRKLTKDSRLVTVHPAGFITNHKHYWKERIGMKDVFFDPYYTWDHCPTSNAEHLRDVNSPTWPMCAGLWWEDVMFIEPIAKKDRRGFRTMPSFRYRCASPPDGKRAHLPAIIASFPLGRMVIVEDPDDQNHLDKMEKIKQESGFDLTVVEA